MARFALIVAIVCLSGLGLASAEPRTFPPFFYPVEHRGDLKALQARAAAEGYELKVVPTSEASSDEEPSEEYPIVEYDSPSPALSLLSFVWDILPSPITAVKAIVWKVWALIWKVIKLTLPIDLVLLGAALVIGFCAFTPYCTLIIEEPIASKLRALGANLPYLDEVEGYFNNAIENVQSWQIYEFI